MQLAYLLSAADYAQSVDLPASQSLHPTHLLVITHNMFHISATVPVPWLTASQVILGCLLS